MADGSSAAGVVLHAVGVEKLNGGAGSEVIAIDLDGLIDPLHASLESRRVSDGLEQDKISACEPFTGQIKQLVSSLF
jgi:hypothetical protein